MLRAAGCGFRLYGTPVALAEAALAEAGTSIRWLAKAPMFPARAKRVIFLFMHGGPSSIDTFDPEALPRCERWQAPAHQAAAHVRGQDRRA
jgi:hypothetical protein